MLVVYRVSKERGKRAGLYVQNIIKVVPHTRKKTHATCLRQSPRLMGARGHN